MPGFSAAERLYRDATDRLEKNFFNTLNEGKNTHFQSRMSDNSAAYTNNHLKDFYERQNAFLQKQQENRQNLASHQEAQYSFKPAINLTSEIICESDPQRQHADQVQRLYQ